MRLRRVARLLSESLARRTGLLINWLTIAHLKEDVRDVIRFAAVRTARRDVLASAKRCSTRDDWYEFACRYFGAGPVQIKSEIYGLLDLLAANETRTACEVGSEESGSSILFASNPGLRRFVVVDLYVKRRWLLRRLASKDLVVRAVDGDSSHPRTLRRVTDALDGEQLDFVLIDGDHTYEGVRKDFLAYRHLVRDGGLIAFHDIQEVTDPGVHGRWVGGVPSFWRQVSSLYPSQEFVDDPAQQGLGIGVLTYNSEVPVDAI